MVKQKERLIKVIGLSLVLIFFTFVLSLSIGLGAKGLDAKDIFDQFLFYFASGGIFLFGLLLSVALSSLITKDDKKYGSYLFFTPTGNAPTNLFKGMTQLQIAWLSLIILAPLGVLAVTKNFTFAGIASLEQQFTPVSQLLFSISLIPGSENIGFALIITLTVILLRYIARKIKMTKSNYNILLPLFVVVNSALYWFINHQLRYSGQEFNLMVVLGFGIVMAILTLVTESFIPPWIFHILNNFFYDAKRIFDSQDVVMNTFLIIIVLAIGYYYVHRGRLLGGKVKKRKK